MQLLQARLPIILLDLFDDGSFLASSSIGIKPPILTKLKTTENKTSKNKT
jgi:hypothetical protein